ncbi:MAG: 30S ribosomal protein S6 [Planctomycetaceae bacterium]|nr:MAG: 30S ribosomal protein S6 [Planctomycetaceae bacterium]
MRRYETIFIAHPDLPDDDIGEVVERLSKIITDLKGIVVKVEKWGKRKLAYPIKKQQKGYYILVDFVGEKTVVVELEKNMKFDDKVLKYLSVKKTEKVDLEEIEKEIADSGKDEETEEITPVNIEKETAEEKTPEESPEEKE